MFYVLRIAFLIVVAWAAGSLQDELFFLYNVNQFPAQSGLLLVAVLLLWLAVGYLCYRVGLSSWKRFKLAAQEIK